MVNVYVLGLLLTLTTLHASAEQDPCECLDWKGLYTPLVRFPDTPPALTSWPRLLCGEAREFFDDGPADIETTYYYSVSRRFQYYEFCESFFHKMHNNYCVNTMWVEYGKTGLEAAQWCVVSNECKDLNGGKRISDKQTFYHGPSILNSLKRFSAWRNFWDNSFFRKDVIPRDVSYKLCTKGKDKMLRDMDPMEFLELARSMDSVIGFATKMAYMRLMPSGHKPGGTEWASVKDLLAKGDIKSMPKQLGDAIAAKEPIVIDVDPAGLGITGQRIIHGKKVYELDSFCSESGCGAQHWPFKRAKDMGEL